MTERERVAQRLSRACADQRLSLDTFSARLDCVYSTRDQTELHALVADLPGSNPLGRLLLATIAKFSAWTWQLSEAWSRPRMPSVFLPARERVVLGRSRGCDCVLSDPTVSRRHALLTRTQDGWQIRDLASRNGTYVNGSRVIDVVDVRPGDNVCLGDERFRLARPKALTPQAPHSLPDQIVV